MTDFKDDREFLHYCNAHSETPRALFSSEQVARCLWLAGQEDNAKTWDAHPGEWRSCDLSDLVKKAFKLMILREGQQKAGDVS